MFKKTKNDLLICVGDQILKIHTVLLYQTFVLLCFALRFLLSSPLCWPGAKHGPWEALAPGHGQDAPWPHRAMRAMSSRRHGAYCAGGHRKRGCGKGIHRADGERVNLPAIDEKKIEK